MALNLLISRLTAVQRLGLYDTLLEYPPDPGTNITEVPSVGECGKTLWHHINHNGVTPKHQKLSGLIFDACQRVLHVAWTPRPSVSFMDALKASFFKTAPVPARTCYLLGVNPPLIVSRDQVAGLIDWFSGTKLLGLIDWFSRDQVARPNWLIL